MVTRGEGSVCSCGWPGKAGAGQTVEEHLRSAWPELLPRERDETHAEWRQRVAAAHGEAIEERERMWEELHMGRPIEPGSEFPVSSGEYGEADDRVKVLEHQLEQLLGKVGYV